MASHAHRVSALAGHAVGGLHGADLPGGPGITIAERRPLTIVTTATKPGDAAARTAVAGVLGGALPESPCTAADAGQTRVLWMQPDRWLIASLDHEEGTLEAALRDAAPDAATIDISNGRTVLRLAGPRVRDVLAKGCPLDLHPKAFGPGTAVTTLLGHLTVMLDCVDADTIDLYVARGFALSCFEWLVEAAAEYGCRVEM